MGSRTVEMTTKELTRGLYKSKFSSLLVEVHSVYSDIQGINKARISLYNSDSLVVYEELKEYPLSQMNVSHWARVGDNVYSYVLERVKQ